MKRNSMATYPVLLLAVQLLDLLLNGLLGVGHVGGRARDGDGVGLVAVRRHHDVDVIALHHLAHRGALLADDEAMVVELHRHVLRDGHQRLQRPACSS